MILNQWKLIAGTEMSKTCVPSAIVGGSLEGRLVAWNGMAADTDKSILYFAGSGGHSDYAGNEACAIDLKQAAPTWKLLRDTTPQEQVIFETDYYADGRPSSTHTYYAMQFISSLNRVFRVGSGSNWGSGNYGDSHLNSFDVSKNDWDPKGTWPDIPGGRGLEESVCKDQLTEEIYTPGNLILRKFSPATGGWASLASFTTLDNYGVGQLYQIPCAVDHRRKKVIFFGDQYHPGKGISYDIATDTMVNFNFSGSAAVTVSSFKENYVWYDDTYDAFFYKNGQNNQVYIINAADFSAEPLTTIGGSTIPNAAAGTGAEGSVLTRWQRVPNLKGYVYYPTTGGLWFLATE